MENLIKATNKAYAAYKAENPCTSEFMETDFKAGFRRGYEAAESSCDLRERAALIALDKIMSGTLELTADDGKELKRTIPMLAKTSVAIADAFVAELNKSKQS
ncbi:MAG: hypothetical protein HDQ88_12530 [Clostridia bacterium]|nr:hypothetical protein [Clostridia bacterium]